ncbi:MAG: iron ABC transporter substrate-binding protein, partial [Spirochaetaceae bacterium]
TVPEPWAGGAPIRYAVMKENREGGDGGQQTVLRGTPQRVVVMVTPVIAHLSDLGLLDAVVAVDNGDYLYNQTVRERIASGRVSVVGGGAELDLERVVALRPDLVLLSALGPDDTSVRRLEAVGVPVVIVADWREQTPLGRAEWILLLGALFGRTQEAQALFSERERDYLRLREIASGVAAADRPRVMANGPWQGSWPVPAGGSYMARLFADAGGHYLWEDLPGTGSLFLDLESVLERAGDADVWVNLNFDWRTREDVLRTDPRLSLFAPFAAGRMYHHDLRVNPAGASDFWESGATRPDQVLADLVSIFHPNLLPGHERVFYRRLPGP